MKIGQKAPDFIGKISETQNISLQDFIGQKIILYFYPKDNTPGCTTQAKDFTCLYKDFKGNNCVIIGVSKDSLKKHDNFKKNYSMPYYLISDENSNICEQYGVWSQKSFMGKKYMGIVRTSFLIDEKGMIEKIWNNVSTSNHAQEILKQISQRK